MHGCFMANDVARTREGSRYRPPVTISSVSLSQLLIDTGRGMMEPKQMSLLRAPGDDGSGMIPLHYAGDISLLDRPCVAVVGSRSASDAGLARATRLARELAQSGIVVVSGLAAGIDAAAHTAAVAAGGSTIAVIGTPLNKAYPAANARLQEEIYRNHLLISPFAIGEATFKSSFPKRNRVMAAVTDATVIIEASDTSGTLHQAAECSRLGRWLFIAKSLVDDASLSWPRKFLDGVKARVLTASSDVVVAVMSEREDRR